MSEVPAAGIFRDDFLLFSESASRFVITVSEQNLEKFKAIFRSIPFGIAGKVRAAVGRDATPKRRRRP